MYSSDHTATKPTYNNITVFIFKITFKNKWPKNTSSSNYSFDLFVTFYSTLISKFEKIPIPIKMLLLIFEIFPSLFSPFSTKYKSIRAKAFISNRKNRIFQLPSSSFFFYPSFYLKRSSFHSLPFVLLSLL